KKVEKGDEGYKDLQGYFFDFWLQNHPDKAAEILPVPADMVMASASGLDPHITLDNAHWQLKHRIAAAWAKKLISKEAARGETEEQVRKGWESKAGKPLEDMVREEVETILREKQEAALGGLAGVPLVNGLAVNRALRDRYEAPNK